MMWLARQRSCRNTGTTFFAEVIKGIRAVSLPLKPRASLLCHLVCRLRYPLHPVLKSLGPRFDVPTAAFARQVPAYVRSMFSAAPNPVAELERVSLPVYNWDSADVEVPPVRSP
eukprot:1156346-Rhodomonas_salina.1